MSGKSIVGELINFRGLVYAPVNENGVIFLFGKVAADLNMYIEEIKPGFPDCVGRRYIGKGWEKVAIEFEYKSSNFETHRHDANICDIVVCWKHDWQGCPIEVIELSAEIRKMDNPPVARPGTTGAEDMDVDAQLDKLLKQAGASPHLKKWYESVLAGLSKVDDSIWAKVSNKYVGWYSPQKAFVSLRFQKTSLRVECFSRGKPLDGAEAVNKKFSPRWVRFSVKEEKDIPKTVAILTESHKRIIDAIRAGETTCYFSGGDYAKNA